MSNLSLSDRLESFAEGWRPKPGEKLIGVITEVDERESDFGNGRYPVITVASDDGREVALHGFHTVLKGELAKKRPAVGDRIGVAYFGRSGGERPYERYRLIVEKPNPEGGVDWDAVAAQAKAEAADAEVPSDWQPGTSTE